VACIQRCQPRGQRARRRTRRSLPIVGATPFPGSADWSLPVDCRAEIRLATLPTVLQPGVAPPPTSSQPLILRLNAISSVIPCYSGNTRNRSSPPARTSSTSTRTCFTLPMMSGRTNRVTTRGFVEPKAQRSSTHNPQPRLTVWASWRPSGWRKNESEEVMCSVLGDACRKRNRPARLRHRKHQPVICTPQLWPSPLAS
jgi:hypothetical protein